MVQCQKKNTLTSLTLIKIFMEGGLINNIAGQQNRIAPLGLDYLSGFFDRNLCSWLMVHQHNVLENRIMIERVLKCLPTAQHPCVANQSFIALGCLLVRSQPSSVNPNRKTSPVGTSTFMFSTPR